MRVWAIRLSFTRKKRRLIGVPFLGLCPQMSGKATLSCRTYTLMSCGVAALIGAHFVDHRGDGLFEMGGDGGIRGVAGFFKG